VSDLEKKSVLNIKWFPNFCVVLCIACV